MEYQSNEEVENLQRQLREEENRTSLAHDEIRRLHRVCQAKDGLFEHMFQFKRPLMYDLGYPNNNCIGCIKGGMGYWNHIRRDFPEVFESRSKLERLVGFSILKDKDGPIYLDELDPDRGDMEIEIFPECGLMCYFVDT